MRRILHDLVELAVPGRCAGCGRRAATLCGICQIGVLRTVHPGGPRRVTPDPLPDGFPPTVAGARLEQPLHGLITAFKDEGRRDLARVLAPLLAASVRSLAGPPRPLVLVPVPSSRASRRHRGDSPLVLLSHAAALLLPAPVRIVAALELRRATVDQAGLDHGRRWTNVAGSMALSSSAGALLRGHEPVLVDDITTSGATLSEAARALRAGGLRARAAVIAATARRQVVAHGEGD